MQKNIGIVKNRSEEVLGSLLKLSRVIGKVEFNVPFMGHDPHILEIHVLEVSSFIIPHVQTDLYRLDGSGVRRFFEFGESEHESEFFLFFFFD